MFFSKKTMAETIKSSLVVAVLAIASNASAANLNHHGTSCHNYNVADDKYFDFFVDGIKNIDTNTRSVICSLVRSPTADNSAQVYVEVKHAIAQTTVCTVYSYNYNGVFLGSQSATMTSTGAQTFDQLITLASPKATYWASLTVLCSLPTTAKIMSLYAVQP